MSFKWRPRRYRLAEDHRPSVAVATLLLAGGATVLAACGGGTTSHSSTATQPQGAQAAAAPPTTISAPPTTTAAPPTTISSSNAASTPVGPTVISVSSSKFGPILADAKGLALYTATGDTATTSGCTASCLTFWPPLLLPAGQTQPVAGPGVTGLGTFTRAEGVQVTYHGKPLYTWEKDTGPGQVTGEGVVDSGGTWHVATVAGTNPSAPSATPQASAPSGQNLQSPATTAKPASPPTTAKPASPPPTAAPSSGGASF
jgi:predicted lipoprotein with Yx(FWY)xxD motif